MGHVIIGTAGHVDHGKTCLIKALTGMDTDRLKEEKERGITIELGFAYMDFSNGQRAGIIDVPGHEKFVKHMLAGAGGIDIAILVVAADEGVMPQTEEHLDILSVLGIKKGVIALTKTDLVEPEFLELVEEDIRNLIKGTFLENAALVPVSVKNGEGIRTLKEILMQICSSIPERQDTQAFRLFADRVFTVKGYGTVITGTLLESTLCKEKEAVLYPDGIPAKIRGIQVHGENREKAFPGERAAVNLADLKKEDVHRGDILAAAGSMVPAYILDVKVQAMPHASREIVTGTRVHVYHGAREMLGKIVLMDRERLLPGDSCYGQIRLESCTAAKRGDHFVIRFYSPQETIGGGIVLDPCSGKKKRNHKEILEIFRIKDKGKPKERLALSILEGWGKFPKLSDTASKCGVPLREAEILSGELCREEKLFCLGKDRYIHKKEMDYYKKQTECFLEEFHKKFPLKEGMGAEEARSRLGLKNKEIADAVFRSLEHQKVIRTKNGCLCKENFQVRYENEERDLMQKIVRDYENAGYGPLPTSLYEKEYMHQKKFYTVFMRLIHTGALFRLNEQYCLGKKQYEDAWEAFLRLFTEKGIVKTGEYRDFLGCSRKIAIALLENFDKKGFTQKTAEGRIPKEKHSNKTRCGR